MKALVTSYALTKGIMQMDGEVRDGGVVSIPDRHTAEREMMDAYVLNGITYLPHYTERDLYVSPWGALYEPGRLEQAGAVKERMYLLKRAW